MKSLTSKLLLRRRNRQGDKFSELHRGDRRAIGNGLEMLEGRRMLSTYYAAPTGSDSAAGTLAAPFASLSKAISTARSGDTVILRGGTYAGNVTINKPNITLRGLSALTVEV